MPHDLRVTPTPEVRLLFQRSDAARNVSAAIDWSHLFEIAEQANSFPVIWRRVSKMADGSIPADIAQRMQRRAMVAEFTLLTQGKLLERALATLASAGIEAMLLKGAGLAVSVYGSFGNRPMGDLDLLVRPEDALRARDALVANGWVWPHDPALDDFYEEHCHLAPIFDASRTGASIELHVDLFPKGHPFGFGAGAMWQDRRSVKVGAQETWIPSPHHQLLHAVIHFAWSHRLSGSAWNTFRDVDALAASDQIDWETFVELARGAGAGSCAYWTLALARALGAAEVPDGVLERLQLPLTSMTRGLVARHVVAGLVTPEARCPSRRLQRRLWEMAIQPWSSGHGMARPWERDDRYTPTRQGEETTLSWRRYLRALVRPR